MKQPSIASVPRVFLAVAVAMVVAALGVGLWLAGSPTEERHRRFDEQRVSELQQISAAVDNFYARHRRLPASLDELAELGTRDFYVPSFVDPETGAAYEYLAGDQSGYELCATFAAESVAGAEIRPKPVRPSSFAPEYRAWEHGAGRHCFTLDAEDALSPPIAVCGITNPCASGQTCAYLPSRGGTFCVPAGKECLAADCPEDRCVIEESYPVRVRCMNAGEPDKTTAGRCTLMRHAKTGKVDCFGCGSRACKDPAPGWEPYVLPPDYIGIPYACYVDESGACALAQ